MYVCYAYTYPETRLVSYYILKSTNLKVKKWTNVIRCAMEKASFISVAMATISRLPIDSFQPPQLSGLGHPITWQVARETKKYACYCMPLLSGVGLEY